MTNERVVGFKQPASCAFCKSGKDPPPGQMICGRCVRHFDLVLCSARYQKVRRGWLANNPYCVQCLRSQLRPKLNGFTLVQVDSTPGECIASYIASDPVVSLPDFTVGSIAYRPLLPMMQIDGWQFDTFDLNLSLDIQPGQQIMRCILPLQWLPTVERAKILDHVLAWRVRPTLFYNERNWQPLCMTCHNVKTIQHDGGFGRKPIT